VSDVKVALQSRLLCYSNTIATAARLQNIARTLIAWLEEGRLCRGGDSVTPTTDTLS